MVQNDYESTNIYIKKQDVENLSPDANGIPQHMVDINNNQQMIVIHYLLLY